MLDTAIQEGTFLDFSVCEYIATAYYFNTKFYILFIL